MSAAREGRTPVVDKKKKERTATATGVHEASEVFPGGMQVGHNASEVRV